MVVEILETPTAGGADADAALSEGEWMEVVCAAGPNPAGAGPPPGATAAVDSSGVELLLL